VSIRRAWPAIVAAVAALALVAPTAGAAPARAQGGEGSSVEDFGACLAAQGGGDVLILLDESASLRDTDPEDQRVTAAQYLLDRLAAFAATEGLAVDVAVAGFAGEYELTTAWTTLAPEALPGLADGLAAYADRDDGFDTDYWNALEGARRTLGDRPPTAGPSRCQAVAWFSDGALDVDPRDEADERDRYGTTKPYSGDLQLVDDAAVAEATRLAEEGICRDGGLADQLRSSGVVTFGIGLAVDGAPPGDFALMESIATGQAAGSSCGAVTEPRPGEFELASGLDDLLFAFDAVATPGRPPRVTETGICQTADACAREQHRFVLDGAVGAVHVLGTVDADGIDAQITTPGGEVLPLTDRGGRDAALSPGGVELTYTWLSERTVEIDLVDPASAAEWAGVWALTFVDPRSASPGAVSRSSIQITGDLQPTWQNAADVALTSGDRVPGVQLGIVDGTGAAADTAAATGPVELSAELRTAGEAPIAVATALTPEELSRPVELDLTGAAQGAATLRLVLAVRTGPGTASDGSTVPGTQLDDAVVEIPVEVGPPAGFPALAGQVDFGVADGATELTGTLGVTGPGCVWLPVDAVPDLTGVPDDAGRISITAPQASAAPTCLRVPEGGSGELELRLTTEQVGNGTATGTVPVMISPLDEPDRARTVEVAVLADLRKPLNTTNFLMALVVALVLGPGIPLLIAYLLKRATARIPALGLAARRIAVTVDSGRVLRDGAPFALDDRDAVHLVALHESGGRRVDTEGVQLRTRTGWSPFGAPFVTVAAPAPAGAPIVLAASDHEPPLRAAGREAVLPLAVHNHWVVLHDLAQPEAGTSVLVLLGTGASPQLRRAIADDIARRLPVVLAGAREAAQAAGLLGSGGPPSGPSGPFGDGPAAAPPGANPFDGGASGGYTGAGAYGAGAHSGAGPYGGAPPAPGGAFPGTSGFAGTAAFPAPVAFPGTAAFPGPGGSSDTTAFPVGEPPPGSGGSVWPPRDPGPSWPPSGAAGPSRP
jgi:hypothetical protein